MRVMILSVEVLAQIETYSAIDVNDLCHILIWWLCFL